MVDLSDPSMEMEDMEDPDVGASNERKLFIEHADVTARVRRLCAAADVDDAFRSDHKQVTVILDRYMEQSYLLDPSLHELVTILFAEIKRVVAGFVQERTAQTSDGGSDGDGNANATAVFPCQIYRNPRLHMLFQLVYHLGKVRGYKTIVKLMPHEASDFEPTLLMLQSQDRSDYGTWETRYVLLLWLSMLCLVPFDLETIDSSVPMDGSSSAAGTPSIVTTILTLCKAYLADPGATQLAAAVCLARLLSRPDMEATHLHSFLRWANTELADAAEPSGSTASFGVTSARVQQFKTTGVILALANLAKQAPRETHIAASKIYFTSVMRLIAKLTDEDGASSSTHHRQLSVKLVQRLGLLYLPPRVQTWRYQRGVRSLELNMGQQAGQQQKGAAVAGSGIDADERMENADDEEDDTLAFEEALEPLEQIVEVLLCGLRDKDTVVRWSAAKGVGRLTARLPYVYADDVVQSVLELFMATESEGAWHGASLALAEMSRRGVLLPVRLTEAVDCVARALQYDVRRGAHSIGAHVRDAACYSCWAFARAFEPKLLLPHLEKTLAPAMLVNCVFDRELTCRRAASAAFQENVGRQGRANFPHGIELLTKADYVSVANLRHAFLDVSRFVAGFPQYRYALLEHAMDRKITHWDASIRVLAATAVGRIAALDTPHAQQSVLPRLLDMALAVDAEVSVRHGATLAIAEVLLALLHVPSFIGGELQSRIKALPIDIEKNRMFRGRGGETIRTAVCYVILVISRAGFALSFAHVKKYLAILEECLVHGVETVRDAAVKAFAVFTTQYCPRLLKKAPLAVTVYLRALLPRFLAKGVLVTVKSAQGSGNSLVVLNPNVAARQGYLRAIGVAANELLTAPAEVDKSSPSAESPQRWLLDDCVKTMVRAISLDQQTVDEQDAGSRVAAIKALVDLCARTEDLDKDGRLTPSLEEVTVRTLIQSIHEDYTTDERGDVGSWVRKEAMIGLERLLLLRHDNSISVIGADGMDRWLKIGATVDSRYGRGAIIHVLGGREARVMRDHSESNATGELDMDDYAMDPVCHVQFDKPALGFYYFPPNGVGLLHLSQLTPASETSHEPSPFMIPPHADRVQVLVSHQPRVAPVRNRRIPATLTTEVICALAKQMSEKLDSMRMVAGKILFRLLHSSSPRVDGIPDRFQLETKLFPRSLTINWSMAHDTFPLVVQMMDIPEYLEAVASGLVVSLGGLTESVVKASRAALFDWFRGHLEAKDFGLLSRFCFFLVALLRRHQHDDRVSIPLMKTVAVMLDEQLLGFLFELKTNNSAEVDDTTTAVQFGERLYDALKDEIQKCTAISKLAAAISVLVGLLPSEPNTESRALRALVMFLAHRFPKVRQLTAEKLYTRLLVHDDVIDEDKNDVVVDILSATTWDGSLTEVRRTRDELLSLLDLDAAQIKMQATRVPSGSTASSETYQTLVQEMSY